MNLNKMNGGGNSSGSVKSDDERDGSSPRSRSGSASPRSTAGSRGSLSGGSPRRSGSNNSAGGGCPSCHQLLCSSSCPNYRSPSRNHATNNNTNKSTSSSSPPLPQTPSATTLLNYQRLASSVPSLMYQHHSASMAGNGGTGPGIGAGQNPNNPYSPDQVAYLAAAAAAAAEHQALYAVAGGGGLPDMKDGGLGPPGWGYPSVYHPYSDPGFAAAAAAAAAAYPFNGYAVDVNGSRRKNATRETTSTLKAWLAEHKKNPYPTKGEKIMLAIITKMTLTQVSTWFANARRRLKKENKMTWEPRNRPDDDDDDVDISDSEPEQPPPPKKDDRDHHDRFVGNNSHHHHHRQSSHGKSSPTGSSCSDNSIKEVNSTPIANSQKPRIWSLADLAGSGTGGGGVSDLSHHPHLLHPHLLHSAHLLQHHQSSAAQQPPSAHLSSSSNNNHHHHSSSNHHGSSNNNLSSSNNHLRHSASSLSHRHLSSAAAALNLPGSAFSPLNRTAAHSESIYRGLYPGLTASHHPAIYHPDNP